MLLSVSVGTVSAGDPVKHSGSIVSIGRDSTFVLAQLGRWSDNWRQRMDTELAISRLAGVRFVTNKIVAARFTPGVVDVKDYLKTDPA